MDGQVLAKSIMSLQGKDLRVVYALFSKTNLGNLVSSKAKDTLAKLSKEESNHFINHLEEEAEKAQTAARALFSQGGDAANMPTCTLTAEDLVDGSIDILGLLVKAELAATRSEARRNVTQGGVTLDGEKVTDIKASYTLDDFKGEGLVLKRGKKKFKKIVSE